jgi:uncharacterized phage protein gp47/JayE
VVVYAMLDISNAAFSGFPQGTNGVAAGEPRGSPATGDQLEIANYIFARQPVTALVTVAAPVAFPVNFTISGILAASVLTKSQIKAAITSVFQMNGSPNLGSVPLSLIESEIAAIPGTVGFLITIPATNVATAQGYLPTVGTITYV